MKKIYLIIALLLLATGVSNATIRYVDNAATGANNGSSWANAYKYLSSALTVSNAAGTSDSIYIAQGTYYPTGLQTGTNRDNTFLITRSGIKLYGGYPTGGGTRNFSSNLTVLSGNINAANNSADNSYHVMVIAGPSYAPDSVVVDGVSITAGNANSFGNFNYGGFSVEQSYGGGVCIKGEIGKTLLKNCTFSVNFGSGGGGMSIESASPTLTNCTFSGNTSDNAGGLANSYAATVMTNCVFVGNSGYYAGGMLNEYSSPMMTNCTFSNNNAAYGGGMYNSSSSPTILNSTFLVNIATQGGGMSNEQSELTITNCTFSGNTADKAGGILNYRSSCTILNSTISGSIASGDGGGMYNDNCSPEITNCVFSGNTAGSTNGGGGGVYNLKGAPTITNTIFSGNSAGYGGGMFNENSSPTITYSRFSGNTATTTGGGLYLADYYSRTTVTSCMFAGNTAVYAAGMFNDVNDTPSVTNCTFSSNTASGVQTSGGIDNTGAINITNCTFYGNTANGTGSGGGLCNSGSLAKSTVKNSIFWGNSGNVALGINIQGSGSSTTTYSLVQGGYPGVGNINTNPLFVNAAGANLELQAASPAINAGNNGSIGYTQLFDFAGKPRIMSCVVDMGAYEYQTANSGTGFSVIYVDSARGSDSYDGATWATAFKTLSYAITKAQGCSITNSILVAKGTYYPTGLQTGTNRDSAFLILRGGLKIYGGYSSGGDTRDITENPTILSGNINATNSAADNSYHVLVIAGLTAAADSVVVDGITITSGNAVGNGSFTYNTTVVNRTIGAGADLASNNGNTRLAFRDCTFSGNIASDDGAALYNLRSGPTIEHCVFSGNVASGNGGAVVNYSSSSTIKNCTFSGNTAYVNGGGMYTFGSAPIITNSTFSGNAAYNDGGGMHNLSSTPTVTSCTFLGNTALSNGGGMLNTNTSSPTLLNCVFSGNSAAFSGGGLLNNNYSSPTLSNCTFAGNMAPAGGALGNFDHSGSSITNTIIFGNSSGVSNNTSSTSTITFSLVQGIGSSNIDPLFVNPQPASAAPTTAGNYRLQTCSPAINAGNNSYIPAGVTTDLAGNSRVFGATVDMGAYEYIPDANTGGLPTANSIVTNIQSTAGATIYADNCNNMLATVTGTNTASSIGGSTTVKVWIDGTQNPQFVKRHYEITPASNATTAAGAVTLYFTQAEFNAFNNANPTLQLPQNLLIEKRSGTSSDGSGHFNTYPGAPTNITPSSVVWNATASRWEVRFFTTGFSGFWVKTQSVPLPVRLSSFTGTAQDCTTTLSWKTATETNFSHFDIERSSDGIMYQAIGKQNAKGSNSSYSFTDNTSVEGQVMYRLKIVDHDGAANYSSIVKLNTDCHYRAITVSPNPATDQVVVHGLNEGDRLSIYDAQGRLVLAERVKNRSQVMSIGNLAAGFYIIKVSDAQNGTVANIKLVKE